MTLIAVSQRVAVDPRYSERRDCLDQAWIKFLTACGLTPVVIPNDVTAARVLCDTMPIKGVLLTGGNDLVAFGGDAPERDRTENALIDFAREQSLPVMGVCRGMQMIQHRCGIALVPVADHVTPRQIIFINREQVEVNSYHRFGAKETRPPLESWALAADGVVKAVRHTAERTIGIMWHPERLQPFAHRDLALFQNFFGSA